MKKNVWKIVIIIAGLVLIACSLSFCAVSVSKRGDDGKDSSSDSQAPSEIVDIESVTINESRLYF